jgi:hypothetical protein
VVIATSHYFFLKGEIEMSKKKKGINNIVSINILARDFEIELKKVERSRWELTEEGKTYLANEKLRTQFAIGQLVWQDVIAYSDSSLFDGQLASRCNKIVAIHDQNVETEMLFVQIDDLKYTDYNAWNGRSCIKGDKTWFDFFQLEKHISKSSGNIWWKV